MSDDLDYVRSRIPNYRGYADEPSRQDSDKRVRAIVGEALSDALVRFSGKLDAAAMTACDELLMQCMFTDQALVRRLDHAKLDPAEIAGLVAADRVLVELEEGLMNASTVDELTALVARLREQFARRREAAQGVSTTGPLSPAG
jgi:hypothetical protein